MPTIIPFDPKVYIPGAARRRIAGNRFKPCVTFTSGNSGYTIMTRRYHKNGTLALSNLRVIVPWYKSDPNNGETTIGGTATVTCSIEYPIGGTRIPFTLNGNSSMSLADKQQLVSDPLGVALPAGARYALYTFVTPSAFIPYGIPMAGAANSGLANFGSVNDGSEYQSGGTDKTISGTTTNDTGNLTGFEPYVVGETCQWSPCILGVGDSIMAAGGEVAYGGGTVPSGAGDGDGNVGWFERMCAGAGIDYLNLSQSSTTAAMWSTAAGIVRRWTMIGIGSSAIVALGTNDLANNNGAAVITNLNAIIAHLAPLIPRVFVATMPPKTTSSDSWATDANQNVNYSGAGTEQCRLNINSGIRGVSLNGAGTIAGAAGVVDVEALTGHARISDGAIVWNASGTTDGVHPSQTLGIAVAAALSGSAYI